MGIRTVIVLSIIAMGLGLMFLFVWIDQRRQQKRLRAIARYNRERQQQNRQEPKGPRVVEIGNKRVIIDPLVAAYDDELDSGENDLADEATFSAEDNYSSELPQPTVIRNAFATLSTPRITPYATPSGSTRTQPTIGQGFRNSDYTPYASAKAQTISEHDGGCCPHHHDDDEFFDDEPAIVEVETKKEQYQHHLANSESQHSSFATSATEAPFRTTPYANARTPQQESLSRTSSASATDPIEQHAKTLSPLPGYITLSLLAEKGRPFGGYDLLQSILGVGLRHGERQIFHRYDTQDPTKILFSLASIAKPGTFSLETMGSFSTPGLIFIFEIERTPELLNSFELLIETALQLSDDLGGSLLDDRREPLNTERVQTLRQQLRELTPGHDYFDEH